MHFKLFLNISRLFKKLSSLILIFLIVASNLINSVLADAINNDIEGEANKLVEFVEENKEKNIKNHQQNIQFVTQKTQQLRNQNNYKKSIDWIAKNNQKLFAKQSQDLPTIDYNITENDANKDGLGELLKNYRFKADEIKKTSISHYPLMIFISSSIPKESIKDLIFQAKRAGAVLVLNGFIGSLKNTQEFFSNNFKDDPAVIIDPRLFELFQVKIVPTFVVMKDVSQNCDNDKCQFSPIHDRIAGNISLQYALEEISKDSKPDSLVFEFLRKIKGDNEL